MAAESHFIPGDIIIDELVIACGRGVFDMRHYLLGADIYESIFKPGIYGEFRILDTDDALGGIILTGDERLVFTFRKLYGESQAGGVVREGDVPDQTPEGGLIAQYQFAINSIKLVQGAGGLQKARTYNIEVVSPEVIASRSGTIQREWTAPVSSVVADVFSNYLGSSRPLFNEATVGAQKLIAASVKPFSYIDQIRRRGVSAKAGPSPYMFFENRDGYHFETLAGMYMAGPMTEYRQSDTMGMNLQTDIDRNIVNFTIVSQANAEARARLGTVKHNVSTIDWLTKTMTSKSSSPGSSWNSGGFGAALKGMGMESFIPTNGRLPNTGIPEATPGTMANASDMIQLIVMTKVLGEPLLQAGKCVTFRIPAQVSTTGPKPIDEIVSGKFLMSKVRHQIGGAQNRPRYYTTVEGVKPEVGGVA